LFSDDGTTRTIPEAEDNVPDVVDDTDKTENVEDHKDMVELVRKYAPIFKLSYVLHLLFESHLPC